MRKFNQWFSENIIFVSLGKRWKGIYIHFLPKYCIRIFLFGIDWNPKPPYNNYQ